jgi:predicted S18 family serine protease
MNDGHFGPVRPEPRLIELMPINQNEQVMKKLTGSLTGTITPQLSSVHTNASLQKLSLSIASGAKIFNIPESSRTMQGAYKTISVMDQRKDSKEFLNPELQKYFDKKRKSSLQTEDRKHRIDE